MSAADLPELALGRSIFVVRHKDGCVMLGEDHLPEFFASKKVGPLGAERIRSLPLGASYKGRGWTVQHTPSYDPLPLIETMERAVDANPDLARCHPEARTLEMSGEATWKARFAVRALRIRENEEVLSAHGRTPTEAVRKLIGLLPACGARLRVPRLSKAQKRIVSWAGKGGCFVHRGEVQTARSLMRMGLGTLEDNGHLRGNDERWYFCFNERGAELVGLTPSKTGLPQKLVDCPDCYGKETSEGCSLCGGAGAMCDTCGEHENACACPKAKP